MSMMSGFFVVRLLLQTKCIPGILISRDLPRARGKFTPGIVPTSQVFGKFVFDLKKTKYSGELKHRGWILVAIKCLLILIH
jgi:hypothetical protein